jgi:hypothetical protein
MEQKPPCAYFSKKQNSYKTGSKCMMQRHKPALGEKLLETRGNAALPSAEKFPVLLNSASETTTFFQKPKTAQKLQFSVFSQKKKCKKISPKSRK